MANATESYKTVAIALHKQGLSLREIERHLTQIHGKKVVDKSTVHLWVKSEALSA